MMELVNIEMMELVNIGAHAHQQHRLVPFFTHSSHIYENKIIINQINGTSNMEL